MMADYLELVQRLRGVNWVCHTYGKDEIRHDTVCHEAVDAIEAQAKRIAELEAALKMYPNITKYLLVEASKVLAKNK